MLTFLDFIGFRIRRRWLSVLIWSGIWLVFGLVFAGLFNTLSKDAKEFQLLLEKLPQNLTSGFNIAGDYLSKVEKYISGQFLTLYTLAGGIFALIIGVSEIGGKIEDKTIVHYLSKNISRASLYLWQSIANILFLGISGMIVWAGLYFEFKFLATSQSEISTQYFSLAFLGTFLLFSCISLFGQLLGVLLSKSQAQYLGNSVVAFMWFLNGLSNINGYPEYLKPWTIYHMFNIAKLRDEYLLDTARSWVVFCFSIAFLCLGILAFRDKDIYV